ncbi:MAG: SDR family oxidoreductase [Mangrovicoccus sp.]
MILVTGAGGGIGAACARALARDGHDLALTYHANRAGAESVAEEIRAMGQKAHLFQADLTQAETAVPELFAQLDATGPLTGLISNAGDVAPLARVEDYDYARLRRIFDLNVIASILVAQQAAKRLSTKNGGPGGAIVIMSSVAARTYSAGMYVDYAATKAALDTFAAGFALELAQEGVRVVSLRPGFIDTELHIRVGGPERAANLGAATPMGRAGTAEEVANAAVFLMSGKADYITGTTLDVAGGR